VLQQLLTLIPNNFSTIWKNGKGHSNLQICTISKRITFTVHHLQSPSSMTPQIHSHHVQILHLFQDGLVVMTLQPLLLLHLLSDSHPQIQAASHIQIILQWTEHHYQPLWTHHWTSHAFLHSQALTPFLVGYDTNAVTDGLRPVGFVADIVGLQSFDSSLIVAAEGIAVLVALMVLRQPALLTSSCC
jgi:hypothetical protein